MIALAVIFLLMVVLLRNFILPLIILLAVPVAGAGGIAGLAILNLYISQPLDMLTMLGFVILTGVVVNNAILMIEQAMLHIREEGMDIGDAIVEATRNRVRPIFMSTLTSLFGLVPLVIFPGAGAELYRGLGVVVFRRPWPVDTCDTHHCAAAACAGAAKPAGARVGGSQGHPLMSICRGR